MAKRLSSTYHQGRKPLEKEEWSLLAPLQFYTAILPQNTKHERDTTRSFSHLIFCHKREAFFSRDGYSKKTWYTSRACTQNKKRQKSSRCVRRWCHLLSSFRSMYSGLVPPRIHFSDCILHCQGSWSTTEMLVFFPPQLCAKFLKFSSYL